MLVRHGLMISCYFVAPEGLRFEINTSSESQIVLLHESPLGPIFSFFNNGVVKVTVNSVILYSYDSSYLPFDIACVAAGPVTQDPAFRLSATQATF